MAVILGNSAVVNSSSAELPASGTLDAMRLNWGPYLWMRCYNNGAQFLDRVVGERPDWEQLERRPRACPPGCGGAACCRSSSPEPSLGVDEPRLQWLAGRAGGRRGASSGASLEALAYLIALGVREHEAAGQTDHAHHGVRRHRPQRPDVRDPGDGAGPAAGALAVVRGAGARAPR